MTSNSVTDEERKQQALFGTSAIWIPSRVWALGRRARKRGIPVASDENCGAVAPSYP